VSDFQKSLIKYIKRTPKIVKTYHLTSELQNKVSSVLTKPINITKVISQQLKQQQPLPQQ